MIFTVSMLIRNQEQAAGGTSDIDNHLPIAGP
jgi:hypothetical protein